tara:strand:- start:786 stop:1061 length:276 start_codon:yes stop_codon:yes gene_type:complete
MFNKKTGVKSIVNNIMYTERGKIILSIVLGLGLATLFRNYCKGKNCYNFSGPEQSTLKHQIFSFDSQFNKCYMLNEENIKCGTMERTIDFA